MVGARCIDEVADQLQARQPASVHLAEARAIAHQMRDRASVLQPIFDAERARRRRERSDRIPSVAVPAAVPGVVPVDPTDALPVARAAKEGLVAADESDEPPIQRTSLIRRLWRMLSRRAT
jgi:hypothetical protein